MRCAGFHIVFTWVSLRHASLPLRKRRRERLPEREDGRWRWSSASAAERELLLALNIRREVLGDDNRLVFSAARLVVQLLEATERPEQAAIYRPLITID